MRNEKFGSELPLDGGGAARFRPDRNRNRQFRDRQSSSISCPDALSAFYSQVSWCRKRGPFCQLWTSVASSSFDDEEKKRKKKRKKKKKKKKTKKEEVEGEEEEEVELLSQEL